MDVDAGELLREFDLSIVEGRPRVTWLLRAPDGRQFEVEPTPPVPRLTAHVVRRLTADGRPRLLVAEAATDGILLAAQAGQVDILTANPPRLVHAGHVYVLAEDTPQPTGRPSRGRPAWTRWTIERYLLLTTAPARQRDVAATARTTQQSVSNAARHLLGLVDDSGEGLVATDRAGLLDHWSAEYPGPGGQQLGWYSLDPVVQQTMKALEAAELTGANALVTGDVAADRLAAWKLPTRGHIYLDSPVDLEIDGFVPAPLAEATLVTCVPLDPTLWWLTEVRPAALDPGGMPLADAAIVYHDLATSEQIDSAEAAEHLASRLLRIPG